MSAKPILPNTYLLSLFTLDTAADVPLYRQIYTAVRAAILRRELLPGMRLPSSRDLAGLLQVSRTTTVNAYEQLQAEGYVDMRRGAGTFVAESVPDDLLRAYQTSPQPAAEIPPRTLSDYGERVRWLNRRVAPPPDESDGSSISLAIGAPALPEFPFDMWARLSARHYRHAPLDTFLGGQTQAGYGPLRGAIASYLRSARAVACEPEQVVITGGAQQSLFIAAFLLLNPGDKVWVENPGYGGAFAALYGAGATFVPVSVDDSGLCVRQGIERASDARMAYVTPSHQFPLGSTMSLTRRLELLQWATASQAWVLEDDYDSEFRYTGPPLASLQGLDTGKRVIYVGSLSKVLFPALRLGYVVLPPDLVDAFVTASGMINGYVPIIPQRALVDFIAEGHFTRHIRRMRTLYAARRECLLAALARELGGMLLVTGASGGMHVTGWLPEGLDDRQVVRIARAKGLDVTPLSVYYLEDSPRGGVVLGYSNLDNEKIEQAVQILAQAVLAAAKVEETGD